jgi:hypothetical protein
MAYSKTFTAEQLHRIYNVHLRICQMRGISLVSAEGRAVAKRLFAEFSGAELEDEILKKFLC